MRWVVLLSFALSLFAVAPAAAETIPAAQAATHAGQSVTIEGVVSNVHAARTGTVFVDVGGSYPNQAFTIVVFKSDSAAVGDLSALAGKTVDVTGTVKLYRGRPEIVVSRRSQITP